MRILGSTPRPRATAPPLLPPRPVAPVVDATLGRARSAPRGHDGVFLHCETVKLLGGPSKAPPYLTWKVPGKCSTEDKSPHMSSLAAIHAMYYDTPPCSCAGGNVRSSANIHNAVAECKEGLSSQRLSKEVSDVIAGAYKGYAQLERLDSLANKEVTSGDVLRSRVVLWVV